MGMKERIKMNVLMVVIASVITQIRCLAASFQADADDLAYAFLSRHSTLSSFASNRRGVVNRIVMLAIGAYVAAATVPAAIVALTNATLWEGAPAAVQTLGTSVIGIVIVTVLILVFLRTGGIND